jgi:hypothetical protein
MRSSNRNHRVEIANWILLVSNAFFLGVDALKEQKLYYELHRTQQFFKLVIV